MKAETDRKIIRAEAGRLGVKYRITKSGQVDFYGVMPNTSHIGWYCQAWDAHDYALQIISDIADATISEEV